MSITDVDESNMGGGLFRLVIRCTGRRRRQPLHSFEDCLLFRMKGTMKCELPLFFVHTFTYNKLFFLSFDWNIPKRSG